MELFDCWSIDIIIMSNVCLPPLSVEGFGPSFDGPLAPRASNIPVPEAKRKVRPVQVGDLDEADGITPVQPYEYTASALRVMAAVSEKRFRTVNGFSSPAP